MNKVELIGVLKGPINDATHLRKYGYKQVFIAVKRTSGYEDTIPVLLPQELISCFEDGKRVYIQGYYVSFRNNVSKNDKYAKKVDLVVLVKNITETNSEDRNLVFIDGTVCRKPNLRKTLKGKDIADLIVSVNTSKNKIYYLNTIVWHDKALETAKWVVGDRVFLIGRIQSRNYNKTFDDGSTGQMTAYEVSAHYVKHFQLEQKKSDDTEVNFE